MNERLKRLSHLDLDSFAVLVLLVFTVFIIPVFPDSLKLLFYDIFLVLIFTWVFFNTRKYRKVLLPLVLIALAIRWVVAPVFESTFLDNLAFGINVLVFLFGVVQLILEVAREKEVDAATIVDAINGYLLLGLAFSALVGYLHQLDPGSFNIVLHSGLSMADYNYFGFVTLSTLGYGDITPQTPTARSIATLGSVAGQMYVAVIVALLVGKYAAGPATDV